MNEVCTKTTVRRDYLSVNVNAISLETCEKAKACEYRELETCN